MKNKILPLVTLLAFVQSGFARYQAPPNSKDSLYLFAFATSLNNNHNGLQFAVSQDSAEWRRVGDNDFSVVKCDYGRWGSEKRMISPYLIPGPDGNWQCVWALNEHELRFAHAASADLVYWGRQSYPYTGAGEHCEKPVIAWDAVKGSYSITYASAGKYYQMLTIDFKTYGKATEVPAAAYINKSVTLRFADGAFTGQVYKVPRQVYSKLLREYEYQQSEKVLNAETTAQDSARFAGLKPFTASVQIQPAKAKAISPLLTGVFFEDINYAADGGLYAELVQNRDFEYQVGDKQGRDSTWNSYHSWSLKGANTLFTIDSVLPLHPNNPHYAVLTTTTPGAALVNAGFDGIPVTGGATYTFSVFTRRLKGKAGKLQVQLVNGNTVLATATIPVAAGSWKKQQVQLTVSATAAAAQLQLLPQQAGTVAVDMVSVFPVKTYKERTNGLRADLAQAVADIHPRFVRFPGGCVSHGDGLENMYRWKNTIGPLEARKPQRNLWNYHQSMGLGYFEYFRFCEDMGAEPVPVLAAGVPCQNSATVGTLGGGQQGGIPMDQMDEYVQDILDLIEYANGDATTTWGRKRAEAGHPQPFHMKYIGIGNEDLISDVFEERFTFIYNIVKAKHPEITVIGTVGPFNEGTDYVEGWKIADKLQVPVVDEHYYQTPGWFINHQDFYDKYERNKTRVYLGEYAAHLPRRPNNLETALAEALYLTAVERNGDVVSMASYAPLLAKEGHTQWSPDLIYFNNTTVKTTVGYEVQKLYGNNSGNTYLPVHIQPDNNQPAAVKRIGVSVVKDAATGDVVVKMVNLLPVTVNTAVDMQGSITGSVQAQQTVLTGKPADRELKPTKGTLQVSDQFTTALPPYSFTVLRIPAAH